MSIFSSPSWHFLLLLLLLFLSMGGGGGAGLGGKTRARRACLRSGKWVLVARSARALAFLLLLPTWSLRVVSLFRSSLSVLVDEKQVAAVSS